MNREWPDKVFKRDIDGKTVVVTLYGKDLVIVGDLITEHNRAAALIGMTSDLVAEWRYACDVTDAEYREWRAKTAEQADRDARKGGEKSPSEHRLKAIVESHRDFVPFKEVIARLYSELAWLEGYHGALHAKIEMLKSRTYLEVRDMGAIRSGMGEPMPGFHGNTRARPAAMDDLPEQEQPKERSREAFKGRRAASEER